MCGLRCDGGWHRTTLSHEAAQTRDADRRSYELENVTVQPSSQKIQGGLPIFSLARMYFLKSSHGVFPRFFSFDFFPISPQTWFCSCSRSRGTPTTQPRRSSSPGPREEEEEEEEENGGDGSYYCHSERWPQPRHRCQRPGSHGMHYASRLASRLSLSLSRPHVQMLSNTENDDNSQRCSAGVTGGVVSLDDFVSSISYSARRLRGDGSEAVYTSSPTPPNPRHEG